MNSEYQKYINQAADIQREIEGIYFPLLRSGDITTDQRLEVQEKRDQVAYLKRVADICWTPADMPTVTPDADDEYRDDERYEYRDSDAPDPEPDSYYDARTVTDDARPDASTYDRPTRSERAGYTYWHKDIYQRVLPDVTRRYTASHGAVLFSVYHLLLRERWWSSQITVRRLARLTSLSPSYVYQILSDLQDGGIVNLTACRDDQNHILASFITMHPEYRYPFAPRAKVLRGRASRVWRRLDTRIADHVQRYVISRSTSATWMSYLHFAFHARRNRYTPSLKIATRKLADAVGISQGAASRGVRQLLSIEALYRYEKNDPLYLNDITRRWGQRVTKPVFFESPTEHLHRDTTSQRKSESVEVATSASVPATDNACKDSVDGSQVLDVGVTFEDNSNPHAVAEPTLSIPHGHVVATGTADDTAVNESLRSASAGGSTHTKHETPSPNPKPRTEQAEVLNPGDYEDHEHTTAHEIPAMVTDSYDGDSGYWQLTEDDAEAIADIVEGKLTARQIYDAVHQAIADLDAVLDRADATLVRERVLCTLARVSGALERDRIWSPVSFLTSALSKNHAILVAGRWNSIDGYSCGENQDWGMDSGYWNDLVDAASGTRHHYDRDGALVY